MTEVLALVAFFVLMTLLVSRMRREQRQQIVGGDRSTAQGTTQASIAAPNDLAATLARP
jgi:hypothetical protein